MAKSEQSRDKIWWTESGEKEYIQPFLSNLSNQLITLENKDFVVWDISPDSTLLGVTNIYRYRLLLRQDTMKVMKKC